MEHYDAVVIGGGPAGSTVARQLHSNGMSVAVLDKASFPRDKVCAGWITPSVVEVLGLDVADYAKERVLQPITAFRTSLFGNTSVETHYHDVVSYGIRRCEFDHYLLQHSGAKLVLGEKFQGMERVDNEWLINERIRTPLVVGAGGHFCPVARYLGAEPGRGESVITAQEVEFALTPEEAARCDVDAHCPELFFLPDLSGYAWIFRKGDYLNVGLGRDDSHRLGDQVAAFLQVLKEQGRYIPTGERRFQGHAYLLSSTSRRKVVNDGVLLVGDAAGLAYPQSGEGIRTAVESALLAAQVVLAAKGDYRIAHLSYYAEMLQRRFGHGESSAMERWLPQGLRQYLGKRLLSSRWFTHHVVLNRWFLHRHQSVLFHYKS